jgi:hypothetical protein
MGMKVIQGDRTLLYKILKHYFDSINKQPACMEIGVLKGENARTIYDIFQPSSMYLVDAWSSLAFSEYINNNSHRSWVKKAEGFSHYFDGSPLDQSTMNKIFLQAKQRFADATNVTIIKESSRVALNALISSDSCPRLDYIYVDGSHQYETVLDDLMLADELLDLNGIIQLNDCCFSAGAVLQNLGVLEACYRFCRMKEYQPIIIANTDWTDICIARKKSDIDYRIDDILMRSTIRFVELPCNILPNLRVRVGASENLSFT